MKKMFIAALAAMTLAACAKDNATTNSGQGEPTTVQLRISQASTYAPAAETDVPTTAEATINGVDVLIFSTGGTLDYKGSHLLTLNKTPEFQVASGNKYIIVMANSPASVTAAINALVVGTSTRTAFEQTLYNIGAAESAAPVASGTNFWMSNLYSSVQTIASGGVAGTPTAITVGIGRVSAKISFTAGTTDVYEPTGVSKVGTLASLEAKLGSVAKNTFYIGQFNGVSQQYEGYRYNYTYNASDIATDYLDRQTTYTSLVANALPAPFYVLESSHDTPMEGNTTRLMVKAVFTPDVAYSYDAATGVAGATVGTDFYLVEGNSGTIYDGIYFNADPTVSSAVDAALAANGFASDAPYTSMRYTNREVYYNKLWLVTDASAVGGEKYCVYRNHHYKVNVTNILGVGWNDDNTNIVPTDPIDPSTTMQLEIDVLNWSEVNQNSVLE